MPVLFSAVELTGLVYRCSRKWFKVKETKRTSDLRAGRLIPAAKVDVQVRRQSTPLE